MKIKRNPQQSGFVLPSLLMVTLILLVVATAILGSGTSSLRVATFDQQSDQALFAAEAGLVRAAEEFVREGSVADSSARELEGSDSQYIVTVYENPGEIEMQIPGGPIIPPSTVYLMAEGISQNGTRRKAGVLFTMGLEAFKVGALGQQLTVMNTDFDAYNSTEGPYNPANTVNDLPLLASNTNDTKDGPTFDFNNAEIKGDVFVGPGGTPATQVVKNGSTTLGKVTAMPKAIKLKDIEVPPDSKGGSYDPLNIPAVGNLQIVQVDSKGIWRFDDGKGLAFGIDPQILKDNAKNPYLAIVPQSAVLYGNDGKEWVQVNPLAGPQAGHYIEMREDGKALYNFSNITNTTVSTPGAESLSNLLFHGVGSPGSPTSVTNPTTLEAGHYDSVNVEDGWTAHLSSKGTYVIKNLNITGTSKLGLLPDGDSAIIYVTESLTVEGEDALFNETRLAPNLQVFYTGDSAVKMAGGSKSYLTLVAPNAAVSLDSLTSEKTELFGALVGKKVDINNAQFHFDTATAGIGTGTQGSALSVIHRHRL